MRPLPSASAFATAPRLPSGTGWGSRVVCALCRELPRLVRVPFCILRADSVLTMRALLCDGGGLPWTQSQKVHRSEATGPPPPIVPQ